jgi:hypothetical protein
MVLAVAAVVFSPELEELVADREVLAAAAAALAALVVLRTFNLLRFILETITWVEAAVLVQMRGAGAKAHKIRKKPVQVLAAAAVGAHQEVTVVMALEPLAEKPWR